MKWINPENGRRQDSAHVMVHPLLEARCTGLRVLTEHKVSRVLIENGRAVGVEVFSNTSQETAGMTVSSSAPQPFTVGATKLVVLSAGTLNTPCILERSGIGRKEILEKLGVETVVELEGVGENFQGQNLLAYQIAVA